MASRTRLWPALALAACSHRGAPPDAGTAVATEPLADGATPAPAPIPMRPRVIDASTPRAHQAARPAPRAGATVSIPAGTLRLGSLPGDPGRDPSVEADLAPVQLAAFDIDALPYPNDPAQPIATGMTRVQAARACAERGRHLCAEAEWERACKADDDTPYPGGAQWDAAVCGHGELGTCATHEGVFLMGTRAAEWTSDDLDTRAVIRGAGRDAAGPMHRCAARRTAVPEAPGLELGFRCCSGAQPPSAPYPRAVSQRSFRDEPMTAAQISQIIAQVPELERLGLRAGLALFTPPAINEVMNHGSTAVELHPEYSFTVNPVRWSPVFGEDMLVLIGRSTPGSWIAALWVLPNGRYRHASSFLLRNDPVSLALAYGPARREVSWAACWNCGGEYGSVTYTEENRAVIVQR